MSIRRQWSTDFASAIGRKSNHPNRRSAVFACLLLVTGGCGSLGEPGAPAELDARFALDTNCQGSPVTSESANTESPGVVTSDFSMFGPDCFGAAVNRELTEDVERLVVFVTGRGRHPSKLVNESILRDLIASYGTEEKRPGVLVFTWPSWTWSLGFPHERARSSGPTLGALLREIIAAERVASNEIDTLLITHSMGSLVLEGFVATPNATDSLGSFRFHSGKRRSIPRASPFGVVGSSRGSIDGARRRESERFDIARARRHGVSAVRSTRARQPSRARGEHHILRSDGLPRQQTLLFHKTPRRASTGVPCLPTRDRERCAVCIAAMHPTLVSGRVGFPCCASGGNATSSPAPDRFCR